MNVSRAGSFYPTTTVVFPEPFDSFFDNDAEWFSMAASQSFSAGPLAFGSDAQPSFGGAGELDDVELVANGTEEFSKTLSCSPKFLRLALAPDFLISPFPNSYFRCDDYR